MPSGKYSMSRKHFYMLSKSIREVSKRDPAFIAGAQAVAHELAGKLRYYNAGFDAQWFLYRCRMDTPAVEEDD